MKNQNHRLSPLWMLAGLYFIAGQLGLLLALLRPSATSFVLLQAFLCVGTIMTLALASEVRARRKAEKAALSLAIVDPLTGLGNYRKLIDALDAEMKRSERTGRRFVFLFVDVDSLKGINDTYGHVAGNRALCRVANVLRFHCRSVDTVARYGGDEFALILPEADAAAAHQVATRITERLARESETPTLSVSIGVAVWPEDGTTIDTLLKAADRALYTMKTERTRRLKCS